MNNLVDYSDNESEQSSNSNTNEQNLVTNERKVAINTSIKIKQNVANESRIEYMKIENSKGYKPNLENKPCSIQVKHMIITRIK